MGLGTKNRQKQKADICKQHLREKYRDGLVRNSLWSLRCPQKLRYHPLGGQFTEIKDIKEEMFTRLVHFGK